MSDTTNHSKRRDFLKKSALGILGSGLAATALSSEHLFNLPIQFPSNFSDLRNGLGLDANITYFNTGSLGPSPNIVQQKVIEASRALELNPVTNNWGDLGGQADDVRKEIAKLINADMDEIVLTRNTTEAMNIVAAGLKLKAGDEILTSTDEHLGGLSCWQFLEKYQGVKIKQIEFPKRTDLTEVEVLSLIKEAISTNTAVCSFMDVSTKTGIRMPMKKLAEICKAQNILLVCDGAQSVGMMNVDVKEMGVDTFATSAHKWLLGPKETGFLYIRKEVQAQLASMPLEAGMKAYTHSMGTRNVANMIGLGTAIKVHKELNKVGVEKRNIELGLLLKEKLGHLERIEIISPFQEEMLSGITSIRLKDKTSAEVYNEMKERGVIIKRLDEDILRFSTHCFIDEKDVELLIKNLDEVLSN